MKNRNKKGLFICVLLLCFMLFSLNTFASDTGEGGEFAVAAADEGAAEKNSEKGYSLDSFIENVKKSSDFLSSLAEGKLHTVYAALLLIASVIICFFAYKFLKYCVGISCFGIGIFATVFISDKMSLLSSGKNKLICLLCAILIGLILSAIAFCLPKAGIFFFSGASAYVILSGLKIPLVATLLVAFVAALIAALLVRVAVIVISSGVGGLLSGAIICSFINVAPFPYFHIPLGLVLFVLGMTVQFSSEKGKRRSRRNNDEQENG